MQISLPQMQTSLPQMQISLPRMQISLPQMQTSLPQMQVDQGSPLSPRWRALKKHEQESPRGWLAPEQRPV
jgi:hypothetical protein